ncbi:MAG: 3-phosphoshikimate 1-carboxyvinyltransferase, partial [Patescibacteria group bacterium]
SGKLRGGKAEVDGTTSQYLSALLFALPLAENDSEITVKKLNERPYAEMTARWLEDQAIEYRWEKKNGYDVIFIKGRQKYHSFKKIIPGDFSSASYLIAAGVLRGEEVRVQGLDFGDPQGDKRLVEIFKKMGADIQYKNNELVIHGGKKLSGRRIDCNDIPDMVPTLAIIATQATGRTELFNAPQARLKETDRIHSICDGLTRLGARVEELEDGLIVYESALIGAEVKGYNDHRTVMALALAGLIAKGTTKIDTAESISKTFPNFVVLMRKLGAKIEMVK